MIVTIGCTKSATCGTWMTSSAISATRVSPWVTTAMTGSWTDVRDRVARVRRQLPEEVDDPTVAKQDSDARAVVWLALSGASANQVQLTSIAETRIKDRLAKLEGVASVIVGGERRYSMRVWIDLSGTDGYALYDDLSTGRLRFTYYRRIP